MSIPQAMHEFAKIFGSNNNSFVAIPFYDMTGNPHDDINEYISQVEKNIDVFTLANSAKVPFTITAPVGASYQSYQQSGIYKEDPTGDKAYYNFYSSSPSYNPQVEYFQAVQSAVCAQNNTTYFKGIDYLSWEEYIIPKKAF